MRIRAACIVLLIGSLSTTAAAQGGRGGRSAGKAAAAATVTTAHVPYVKGDELTVAQNRIIAAHLTPRVMSMAGRPPMPGDIVIRQAPDSGKLIPLGDTVTIAVSAPAPSPVAPTPDPTPKKPPTKKPNTPVDAPTVELVPDVVGRPLAYARAVMAKFNLQPNIKTVPTRDTALGSVVDQAPRAKQPIRPDRSVDLIVAGVPQLTGLTPAEAGAAIKRAHLTPGAANYRESSSGTDNTVIGQDPSAGQPAPPQATVNLTIARVVHVFPMPKLVGLSTSDARALARDSGLFIRDVSVRAKEGQADTVVDQKPGVSVMVRHGDSVAVLVGRAVTLIPVPQLVGAPISVAHEMLAGTSLALAIASGRESDSATGTIVRQRPDSGAHVTRGTTVVVDTALPRLISIPEFVGKRIDSVFALADPGSLQVVTRYTAPAAAAADSVVATQSVEAGTRVPMGSSIVLTLSQTLRVSLLRITVEPAHASISAGDTVRLTAIGHFSDSSRAPIQATWSVRGGGTITANGLYTGAAQAARVIITASSAGLSGNADISVGRAFQWWLIALITLGVGGSTWGVWRYLHQPDPPNGGPPPPPLVFTYKHTMPEATMQIDAAHGHGSELSLVSYAGEVEQSIHPENGKLFEGET